MTSNRVSTSNSKIKKRIKPEQYTPQMYAYFQKYFTPNLAFIRDTGSLLETDTFFDLCMSDSLNMNPPAIDMEYWLKKRKHKIQKSTEYDDKNRLLKEFFEDYKAFFTTPSSILSGSIQNMIDTILS